MLQGNSGLRNDYWSGWPSSVHRIRFFISGIAYSALNPVMPAVPVPSRRWRCRAGCRSHGLYRRRTCESPSATAARLARCEFACAATRYSLALCRSAAGAMSTPPAVLRGKRTRQQRCFQAARECRRTAAAVNQEHATGFHVLLQRFHFRRCRRVSTGPREVRDRAVATASASRSTSLISSPHPVCCQRYRESWPAAAGSGSQFPSYFNRAYRTTCKGGRRARE